MPENGPTRMTLYLMSNPLDTIDKLISRIDQRQQWNELITFVSKMPRAWVLHLLQPAHDKSS